MHVRTWLEVFLASITDFQFKKLKSLTMLMLLIATMSLHICLSDMLRKHLLLNRALLVLFVRMLLSTAINVFVKV